MAPKRKRQAANGTAATSASAEDLRSTNAGDVGSGDKPPTKRTRAGSRASATGLQISTARDDDDMDDVDDDDDEAHDTEAAGLEEAERELADRQGENGEAGKMRMDAPGRAGLVDPVGYKTNAPPTGRAVRVYADGVFDLFHLGHMRQLQQAKTAFPDVYLLVGVTGDRETHRRKGLTVLSAAERAESVRHCKWVDEVVEDCPWIVTPAFLAQHAIDYVAHDDLPYGAAEGDDIYEPIKSAGQFLVTQRTEGVSTTGIITKIVRDYESYIARQLQRGQSRKELNISWLKKNELDIKRHVKEVGEAIRTNWSTTGQELSREFRQFWLPGGVGSGASRPSSPALGSSGSSSAGQRGRKAADQHGLTSPVTPGGGAADGGAGSTRSAAQSPGAWSRLSIPGSSSAGGARDRDFAAGYAMGLLGSVRGWMQRNRRNLNDSTPTQHHLHSGTASAADLSSASPSGSGSDDEHDALHDSSVGSSRKGAGQGNGGLAPSSVVDKLEASVASSRS